MARRTATNSGMRSMRVVNAHRSLSPKELSRRYRAHREDVLLEDDPRFDEVPWWDHCPYCILPDPEDDPEETRREYRMNQQLDAIWECLENGPLGVMGAALSAAGCPEPFRRARLSHFRRV